MRQRLYGEMPLLMLFSVLLVTLFSTCSFLYPLNPWDDAKVYMTIGNAMLSGKELYADIFDHKGPVLFFLHEWAAMLSRSNFVGIYLVELVCCFFYLRYSLFTMRLFSSSSFVLPLTLFIGLLTYSSDFFSYGDSVEEFSLPLLAHCLYYMLRFVKERRVPQWWQAMSMGIGLAVIFWMKFNILIFYVGAVLCLVYIAWRHRQLKELETTIGWALAGFLAVTVPVLAYFAVHGTLADLWESYFMVNVFSYHGTATNGEPPFWWFKLIKLGIWAVLMLPLVFLPAKWEVKLLAAGTYGLLLLSYATMTVQFYYFLTIFTFFPLLICYFSRYEGTRRAYAIMLLVSILAAATNWNLVSLLNGKFQRSVLEMADIVNANDSEDSEVLTFSSYDTGIYLFTNHLPPNRNYFLSSILDPEIKRQQAEIVASGKIRYLVRQIEAVTTCHEYYDAPIPANYQLVYEHEELFRYRFITTPHKFLWNLVWPRAILKYVMDPVDINQQVLMYERVTPKNDADS